MPITTNTNGKTLSFLQRKSSCTRGGSVELVNSQKTYRIATQVNRVLDSLDGAKYFTESQEFYSSHQGNRRTPNASSEVPIGAAKNKTQRTSLSKRENMHGLA
jgi:hypothetical protein